MKKELILKILNELDKNNRFLSQEDVKCDNEQYGQILDIILESNLITGVEVKRVGNEEKYSIKASHPKITLSGIEYLQQSTDNYNRLICAMNNIPSEIGNSKIKLNINRTY
ncbi:YjcQ family protein [Clostridium lacusfryxellense]|uniref:YjcQ family protein n=1 Tax=Clostridium lacusfryxellense TaxID=205328 RepID=UPI001C0D3290|nr:YjcQ family protein [Clostridium lacusfryxellense]MBU3112236.1 YjcQ family protein [Clostridium lacusfryxellense]